ncbi:MAG: helix-turn-helix domain-containing protein [Ruminococcaceae bacterium]|nr:helix-turn-helix domain-containing protein [Oscillospiraceae bacterium]
MQILLRCAKCTTYLPNNFTTRAYDCRLLFILNGKGKILLNDREYSLKENTIAYYPAGTRYFPQSSSDFPLEFITLNFDFDRKNENLSKILPTVSEEKFIEANAILPTTEGLPELYKQPFILENTIEYRDDFIKLSEEFTKGTPLEKQKAEAKLQYLLLCIATHPLYNTKDIFSQTINFIKNNLFTIQTNEDIARVLNYHSYYLNKIFKDRTGTSIHQYIINERLKYAANLLITTTYSINQIASLSGFENARHFSTAFQKKYKCTPSSMRKKRNTFI